MEFYKPFPCHPRACLLHHFLTEALVLHCFAIFLAAAARPIRTNPSPNSCAGSFLQPCSNAWSPRSSPVFMPATPKNSVFARHFPQCTKQKTNLAASCAGCFAKETKTPL